MYPSRPSQKKQVIWQEYLEGLKLRANLCFLQSGIQIPRVMTRVRVTLRRYQLLDISADDEGKECVGGEADAGYCGR